jgi:Domain of unknown function (DUF3332)
MKKSFLACALALTLLGTSCLGPNKLFNGLNEWNTKATDTKWGNEAVFLGLNILFVYPFCYLADVVVFNSIEFWKQGSTSAGPAPAK